MKVHVILRINIAVYAIRWNKHLKTALILFLFKALSFSHKDIDIHWYIKLNLMNKNVKQFRLTSPIHKQSDDEQMRSHYVSLTLQ